MNPRDESSVDSVLTQAETDINNATAMVDAYVIREALDHDIVTLNLLLRSLPGSADMTLPLQVHSLNDVFAWLAQYRYVAEDVSERADRHSENLQRALSRENLRKQELRESETEREAMQEHIKSVRRLLGVEDLWQAMRDMTVAITEKETAE